MKRISIVVISIFLALAIANIGFAEQPAMKINKPGILEVDVTPRLNANNVEMIVTNIGSFGRDIPASASGTFFPKGSGRSVVYASGLWIGGKVNGELRTSGAEYSEDYSPGPVGADPADPDHIVYSVRSSSAPGDDDWDTWVSAGERLGEAGPPIKYNEEEGQWEPDFLGDQALWCIYNDMEQSRRTSDQGTYDHVGLEIKQMSFAFNQENPLGNIIFLQFKVYNKGGNYLEDCYISLWSDPDLGDANDDLVGVDVDKSLGYCYNGTNNDQQYGSEPPCVGYDFFQGPLVPSPGDTGRAFGELIPDHKNLGMSSFNKYLNGTDPQTPQETYNFMQGLDGITGEMTINPTTGLPTPYFFEGGDPVTGTGWIDTSPDDRRFMQSTGPFTFAPGDSQEILAAIIVGQGTSRLSSITVMRYYDEFAQQAFEYGFNIPPAPQRPQVTIGEYDRKIVLSWDDGAERNPGAYDFQGYNVYQSLTPSAGWELIATYDRIDGVGVIKDVYFDNRVGQLVDEYPVQFGSDAGVQYTMEITQDYIEGGDLINNKPYFYAVTAYSYNPTQTPRTLESSIQNVRIEEDASGNPVPRAVIPQTTRAGADWDIAEIPIDPETELPYIYHQVETSTQESGDEVVLEIVDPAKVTGHDYRIDWTYVEPIGERDVCEPIYDENHNVIGQEVVGTTTAWPPVPTNPIDCLGNGYEYKYTWSVTDVTTGELKIDGLWNKLNDENFPVIDGVKVKVLGNYTYSLLEGPPVLGGVVFVDPEGNDVPFGNSPMTSVNWGGGFFAGGVDYGAYFFGSNIDPVENADQLINVQLIWKNDVSADGNTIIGEPMGQKVYSYDRGQGYAFDGLVDSPVEAWEVDKYGAPVRQLNICCVQYSGFVEAYNDIWSPVCADVAGTGGREYLFIMNSDYDGNGGAYDETTNILAGGGEMDVLYAGWLAKTDCTTEILAGSRLDFRLAGLPSTENDYFTYSTKEAVTGDVSLTKKMLDDVLVVPNPYYAYSAYEVDQFNRVVKFTHLPYKCTIRLFTLAGDLVRTIEKNDETSEASWNLLTKHNLPIASGMYIYHIEAYEKDTNNVVAEKVGKMAVFMEEERLNRY